MNCNWSEYGFGLVLNDDEAEALRKEVVKKNFPEFDIDMHSIWELPENFETIIPSLCVRYYDEDMDGKSFHGCKGNEEYGNMLVFWAENQPDAFKAAYGSIEETVKEFRKKIGKYLPDTFDYPAHIGYFSCCVYC